MNINTVNTKEQQLRQGYFKIGMGSEIILIIGSCRAVPYLNYLNLWNEQNGVRFTITFIDPFNFNYDDNDNRVDIEAKINSMEKDDFLLNLLSKTSIFIHEYYANFGMFNCDKKADKNIYQFGLKPGMDICIPNFNDNFILVGDIVKHDKTMRDLAIQDYNVIEKLSDQTYEAVYAISRQNVSKFLEVCKKSDIPEMGTYFVQNFTKKRFHWNSNHVSKHFTLFIFKFIMENTFGILLSKEFEEEISQHDMYANNYTPLTEYDMRAYGYEWKEFVVPLKQLL